MRGSGRGRNLRRRWGCAKPPKLKSAAPETAMFDGDIPALVHGPVDKFQNHIGPVRHHDSRRTPHMFFFCWKGVLIKFHPYFYHPMTFLCILFVISLPNRFMRIRFRYFNWSENYLKKFYYCEEREFFCLDNIKLVHTVCLKIRYKICYF